MVKRKYDCPECQASFRRRAELQCHMREERLQGRPNTCPVCRKSFSTKQQLKMHSLHHNVGGEFRCYYCNKEFNKAWKLKIHHVNHTGRVSYLCKICGDDYLYPGKLVYHMKHIHELWHCCRECGDGFQTYYQLQQHICKIYGCKDCTLWFESQEQLTQHITVHTNTEGVDVANKVEAVLGDGVDHREETHHSGIVQSSSVADLPQSSHGSLQFDHQGTGAASSSGCSSNRVLGQDTAVSASTPSLVFVCHEEKTDNNQHSGSHPMVSNGCEEKQSSSMMVKTDVTEPRMMSDDTRNVQKGLNIIARVICKEQVNSEAPCTISKFKVPASKVFNNKKKLSEGVSQSFPRLLVDTDKAVARQESILQKLHLYVDADAKLTERSKASFETWLCSDPFPSTSHDFVFGFESSPSKMSEVREHQQHQHFHQKIPQKINGEMTFEDLCKF